MFCCVCVRRCEVVAIILCLYCVAITKKQTNQKNRNKKRNEKRKSKELRGREEAAPRVAEAGITGGVHSVGSTVRRLCGLVVRLRG